MRQRKKIKRFFHKPPHKRQVVSPKSGPCGTFRTIVAQPLFHRVTKQRFCNNLVLKQNNWACPSLKAIKIAIFVQNFSVVLCYVFA